MFWPIGKFNELKDENDKGDPDHRLSNSVYTFTIRMSTNIFQYTSSAS